MKIPYLEPPCTSKATPLAKVVPTLNGTPPRKNVTVVLEQAHTITVTGPTGPQGGAGPIGPIGPQGPAGVAFNFTQGSASNQWTINHNLGYKPTVELFTSGGAEFEADIVHVSDNQCVVYLTASIAGSARCV